MSGWKRITTKEAIEYALDPRNDNGEPNQLHVMAFSYDSDCPNDDDHDSSIIESDEGFWNNDTLSWGIEADATEYTQALTGPTDTRPIVNEQELPVGKNVRWLHEVCRCYDGISSDDADTWTDPESGEVDEKGFGEWGPFELQWPGEDPGAPRGFTPEEALEAIASRIGVFEQPFITSRMNNSLGALYDFIKQVRENGSTDLEWGEPGDCSDRMENDPEDNNGRHYGDPHCIWCLQAS